MTHLKIDPGNEMTVHPVPVLAALCLLLFLTACTPTPDPATSMSDFCTKYPRPEFQSLTRVKYDSDWFELYRVAPGVTAITEPHQWQETISYLIEGADSVLLFDTGNGIADLARVITSLTDKPVTVLNSHTHYDHVGGNYQFDTIFGLDTDFTRARQAGQPNKDIRIEVSPAALCIELPEGVAEENHLGKPFTVERFINDGYIFDLGDRQLEVLHIPGHTPDAIALIDRDAGLLWTGDSYYSGPIWLYAPETDLNAYAQSLNRLVGESQNLKALLPAHNTPWVDPGVLPRLRHAFNAMLNGDTTPVDQGEGMVEYTQPDETEFSFLMRDETLPYKN